MVWKDLAIELIEMIIMGDSMNDYIQQQLFFLQDFLHAKGIRYFQSQELVTGLNRGNMPPEKELWSNIIPTLKILDECREKFGRIRINSCYRNLEFNNNVGGSKSSLHKDFKACDINPLDSSLIEVAVWLKQRIPNDSWGLKLYETFIHIDCRSRKYRKGF